MISTRHLLIALIALPAAVDADVPTNRNISYYQRLWTDSPFTIKPEATSAPAVNLLADYVLLGVSPIDGGYRVTMLNKKKPTDPRIVVETGRPAGGFQIIEVIRKPGMPLATEVKMSSSGTIGTVAFEDKFLKLEAPKPAPAGQAQNPEAVNQAAAGARPPLPTRPRIVRPPTPATNAPVANPPAR